MSTRETPLTLDAIACDPSQITRLPLSLVWELIGRTATVQAALTARMVELHIQARGSTDHHPDHFLTVPEVAKVLRCKPAYAYELARRGELPAIRYGKYVRVPLSALKVWLQKHQPSHQNSGP